MNPSTSILLIATCMLPSVHLTDPMIWKRCSVNSDCYSHSTCIHGECADACRVELWHDTIDHIPICQCAAGYTGNPYFRCTPVESECPPDTCGFNTFCKIREGHPVCTCLDTYIGDPLIGCRQECDSSDHCGSDRCCRNSICHPGACEPFEGSIPVDYKKVNPEHPCDPDPCSENEICRESNGTAYCQCRYAPYSRHPESGCNPECITKFNCASEQTCINSKCVDSCPGNCGPSDECFVFNHKAKCRPKNSLPECTSTKDCSSDEECDGYKCIDPCMDYCDPNSDCQTVNQRPMCTCKAGYYRGYYGQCYKEGRVVE